MLGERRPLRFCEQCAAQGVRTRLDMSDSACPVCAGEARDHDGEGSVAETPERAAQPAAVRLVALLALTYTVVSWPAAFLLLNTDYPVQVLFVRFGLPVLGIGFGAIAILIGLVHRSANAVGPGVVAVGSALMLGFVAFAFCSGGLT